MLTIEKKKSKSSSSSTSYKEPTADEIQSLRETEELFKSNVFKWQMEELLKEKSVPYGKCEKLEKAFWDLKSALENVEEVHEQEVITEEIEV